MLDLIDQDGQVVRCMRGVSAQEQDGVIVAYAEDGSVAASLEGGRLRGPGDDGPVMVFIDEPWPR